MSYSCCREHDLRPCWSLTSGESSSSNRVARLDSLLEENSSPFWNIYSDNFQEQKPKKVLSVDRCQISARNLAHKYDRFLRRFVELKPPHLNHFVPPRRLVLRIRREERWHQDTPRSDVMRRNSEQWFANPATFSPNGDPDMGWRVFNVGGDGAITAPKVSDFILLKWSIRNRSSKPPSWELPRAARWGRKISSCKD